MKPQKRPKRTTELRLIRKTRIVLCAAITSSLKGKVVSVQEIFQTETLINKVKLERNYVTVRR